MTRLSAACVAALALWCGSARAEWQAFTFGARNFSCANWTPDHELEMEAWILEFWSGMNGLNPRNREAGHMTDAKGVIESVRQECRLDPSLEVINAPEYVYRRLQSKGR